MSTPDRDGSTPTRRIDAGTLPAHRARVSDARRDDIRESWVENADAWTDAVRAGRIASRRLGTDAAVVAACRRALDGVRAPRVLDVGCGEGWLARALSPWAVEVLGVDESGSLVRCARDAARGLGNLAFEAASYDDLARTSERAPGPFDLVVANYALLDDRVGATLRALATRLGPRGRMVIQTVHPWTAQGDEGYVDGWRVETFAAFEQPFPRSMPWYFRTLGSWMQAVAAAGLAVDRLDEPVGPDGKPLSLLLTLARAAR